MTSILLRLFLILLGIWVIRQLLRRAFGSFIQRHAGSSATQSGGDDGRKMVKDPVCGMYLDPGLAMTLKTRRGAFHFCSDECRQKFLSQPN